MKTGRLFRAGFHFKGEMTLIFTVGNGFKGKTCFQILRQDENNGKMVLNFTVPNRFKGKMTFRILR